MQPAGPSTSQTHLAYETATPADRELLIDIDFFDAKGRWNPTGVVFCAAEDQARAKSLWTRCFRGFMALHGKLWAKNYLSSHFRNKPESKAVLEQIKQSGFVDNKVFRETVAQCTLLYKDLGQVAAGKVEGENRIVPAAPISDLDKVVSRHFLHINWKEWKEESEFQRITLPAAQNICNLIKNLKIDESNDALINELSAMMDRYEKWVEEINNDRIAIENSSTRIAEGIANHQESYQQLICTIIPDAIKDYQRQRGAQEPIENLLDAIVAKKEYLIKKGFFNISFVGELENSGLLDYLRRGNAGFIEECDLRRAERVLNMTDDQLRQQADFLSESEFELLKRRFEKLKKDLPTIKAEITSSQ